jgi:predicted N-acyltransferase
MTFDVQIAHSVAEIGVEAWDRLGADRPFSSYRWYRYGETVLADDVPIYVVLRQHGEPVARAAFWLKKQEQLPVSSRAVRWVLESLIRRRPLLECQSPLAQAPGLVLPDHEREACLSIIMEVALTEMRRRRVSFLVWNYLDERDVRCPAWPQSFVKIRMSERRTWMDIVWQNWKEYSNDLGRETRRSYRRNCRDAAEQGIQVKWRSLSETPLGDLSLDEGLRLIRQVEVHHGTSPCPWARALLQHAGMADGTWLEARIGDKLAACCIMLADRDVWMATLMGRDYGVRYAYFVLFYKVIECAIVAGARVLVGGTGNYDFKHRMGFRLLPRHHVVMAAPPAVKRLAEIAMHLDQEGIASVQDAGSGLEQRGVTQTAVRWPALYSKSMNS